MPQQKIVYPANDPEMKVIEGLTPIIELLAKKVVAEQLSEKAANDNAPLDDE